MDVRKKGTRKKGDGSICPLFSVTDYEDVAYTGKLDATGSGKVDNHYCGPVVLKLNQPYEGQDETLYWQGDAPV